MRAWPFHFVSMVLLAGCALAVIAVQRGSGTDAAIEATTRRYADAISRDDSAAALSELVPASREQWAEFVQEQAGNKYAVRSVSVRSRSLLSRMLRGGSGLPIEETVALDVNRDDPASYFQANARTPIVLLEGRWYLSQPPLTGDELPQPAD